MKLGPYELDQIYTGDARELAQAIPDESVDLVITSPPYNLGSRYANCSEHAIQGKWNRVIQYGNYNDDMPEDQYLDWQRQVILDMWRIIKPTGAIFYNHRPRIQDGRVWHRLDMIPDSVTLRQIIIWKRPKGHNFNRGYFVPSYEWILLLAKPEFELSDSGPGDIWEFSPTTSNKSNGHSAPFPIDLPLLAIRSSYVSNIILDPFIGSGTTLIAAKIMGRHGIGFEIDPDTAERARQRVEMTQPPLFVPQPEQLELEAVA